MKRIKLLLAAAVVLMMTACGNAEDKNVPDTKAAVTETAVTTAETKKEKVSQTTKVKEIKPLNATKTQGAINNSQFSVTAEMTDFMSVWYYPDIIAMKEHGDDDYILTVSVKAKNISQESAEFDPSKLSLSADTSVESICCDEAEIIDSGDSIKYKVMFKCTLDQMKMLTGVQYDGADFEFGGEMLGSKVQKQIKEQSMADLKTHKYREFLIDNRIRHTDLFGDRCYASLEKEVDENGYTYGEYFVAKFTIYNRTDYAQVIDPYGFVFGGINPNDETKSFLPVYCYVDEERIHAPVEADVEIKGLKKVYEMPELITLAPDNPTVIKLVYHVEDYNRIFMFTPVNNYSDNDRFEFFNSSDSGYSSVTVWFDSYTGELED